MAQLLLDNFRRHIELSSEEADTILKKFKKESYKSKTVLIRPGMDANFTYFVLKGVLRSYTIDANGAEHILNIATPNWWMADMYSYLGGKPAIMYVDVVDDCELLSITREEVEALYEEIPRLERFFRILTENNLLSNQQRVLDKMSLTAEERYEKFIKKHPEVTQCLPQKYIASYIGVTPEFFSKMKSRMLRNK